MFTDLQMKTLQAAVNRVIPADEWPGGWEAGVGDYLMRQFGRDLKDAVDVYRRGLDGLEAEALANHGAGFAGLETAAQDVLLTAVEGGETQAAWSTDAAAFFTMLCHHCAEGYYSDPGNGGNRGGVSWKMIGFEVRG